MRDALAAAVLGLLVAVGIACLGFDLESRRFRCDGDPAICGDGLVCGADGYCAPGDAAIDAPADASPADLCPSGAATCGIGCVCEEEGRPKEVGCQDGLDNDQDGMTDCQDPDCPTCAGNLTCCPSGACLPSC